MNIELVNIKSIKCNPNNPRVIKDYKFDKLVKSIKVFPEMLKIRPIVTDEDMIVLGGNMRLKACETAGLKEVYIIKASELTEEQKKEFIIKDNVGFGDWDYDILANEWDNTLLDEWGLYVPQYEDNNIDLDKFFEEVEEEKISTNKIVLEYTPEEYEKVMNAFKQRTGSKESIIYELLGIE